MILIASFPRSGNHLVRFLVEYATGRPTLGCRNNPQDSPIHQSFSGQQLLHVDTSRPIARKAHFAREIRAGLAVESYTRMIYIERDARRAIASHVKDLSGLKRIRAIAGSALRYYALRRLYKAWPHTKTEINYERLVSEDWRGEIQKLLAILGTDADADHARYIAENFELLRDVYSASPLPSWKRPFVSDVKPLVHSER